MLGISELAKYKAAFDSEQQPARRCDISTTLNRTK